MLENVIIELSFSGSIYQRLSRRLQKLCIFWAAALGHHFILPWYNDTVWVDFTLFFFAGRRIRDSKTRKVTENSVKCPLHPVPPSATIPGCCKPQPTGLEHGQGWENTKRWINGCLILILKKTRKIFVLFCVITFDKYHLNFWTHFKNTLNKI